MIWLEIVPHISKSSRYTLGARIENKFLDLLDLTYLAYFSKKEDKPEKIAECILLLDTLKFVVSVAWEGKVFSNSHFEKIASNLEEVGWMLFGWKESLANPEKKNRTFANDNAEKN